MAEVSIDLNMVRVSNEEFLKKAADCAPQLKETLVRPVEIVDIPPIPSWRFSFLFCLSGFPYFRKWTFRFSVHCILWPETSMESICGICPLS